MTLDDHIARDEETRERIRTLLDETMFVEAGAGTGKTRALVDRYVALVLAGHEVDRIVAITFTEKAAAELRDRVRSELESSLGGSPGGFMLISNALTALDRARVSTIHAFAHALLRSFAVEAAIDPAFELQDEVAADRRFEERWRAYLEDLAADGAAVAAFDRGLSLGLTTKELETLAYELWTHTELAETLAAAPIAAPAPFPLPLEPLVTRLDALQAGRVIQGDLLRSHIERLQAIVAEIAAVPDHAAAILKNASTLGRKASMGNAQNWGGRDPIARARSEVETVCSALLEHLAAHQTAALGAIVPHVVRFVVEEARARCREGRLVFDDLILRLRDVLRDVPAVRAALRERYDAMLIDEFQDTDPLQVEIALLFATDPATGRVEPGRLFCVGDPKQSIYRFRRADMTVYADTRRRLESEGAPVLELALNRRSRAAVLDWVNAVFESMIGDGHDPAVQAPYRPVHAEREASPAGPGVALLGEEVTGTVREVRREETRQVAAWCREALAEGWQVQERDGSFRSALYRDIAILLPTRAVLQPLERALGDAGVPYRVESGSLVYGTQEVRDLINALTAIDDPTDDVAIVAALRSPAYACSDVELARYKLRGGSFSYLAQSVDTAAGPVADGLRSLRELHRARRDLSLAALVERFLAERRVVEIGAFDSGTRDAFRRARFVVEQARTFEAAQPESLRAFVRWLEGRAGDAILDHEGAGLDEDEDAVRILTVHGAKGLEFPIVFLAGIGVAPRAESTVAGIDRSNGRIGVAIGVKGRNARHTLGPIDAIDAQETLHSDAERARLLYVAATRARDHLIVSLHHKTGTKDCGAKRLINAGAPLLAPRLERLLLPAVAPAGAFSTLTIEQIPDDDDAFLVSREQLVVTAGRHVYTSATAMHTLDGKEERGDDETEPWARGRGGTHRGRAVHATLQSLDWDPDDAAIEAVASAQAVAEAIPDEAQRVAELVRRALASEAAARARSAARALREVPFALRQGDVTLEGFIDLVIETPEGLEVVDWKTDAVPEAAVPERLRQYELQAGLYVLGLEAAAPGRRVTRLTYVFVDPAVERSPGEPEALREAAREALANVAARSTLPSTDA